MIPLFKPFVAEDAAQRVADTLASGYLGQGPRVEEFEEALQGFLGLPSAPLTTSSGTAALTLACRLLGVNFGDEVITTPMTCTATNTPFALTGATLVWADIDPRTGLIDPEDVRKKLTYRTKAIVAVDWAGRRCDYAALKEHGVPVVQDAAHAFGAEGDEWGDYVCWSFQAIKHLTTGDGGALWTPIHHDMERGRLLRWFGLDRRSSASFRCQQRIKEIGDKLHMNDIAASIGLANLPEIPGMLLLHRAHAATYHHVLGDLPGLERPPDDSGSAWWLYTVLVDRRSEFEQAMTSRGIETSQVHSRNDQHPAFRKVGRGGPLPGVDDFTRRQLAIPVGWWLTGSDVFMVASAARAATAVSRLSQRWVS